MTAPKIDEPDVTRAAQTRREEIPPGIRFEPDGARTT
jgi:hypothetical protein